MFNPMLGDVAIKLGERDLVLNYSIHAIIRLEQRLGQDTMAIGRRWRTDQSIGFLRTMFWAAVVEHQRDYDTPDPADGERAAGELMRLPGAEKLWPAMVEAWKVSWPIPPAETADSPPADRPETAASRNAKAGTGKASSAAGSNTGSAPRKRSSVKPRASSSSS